jgi:hypothetical protein
VLHGTGLSAQPVGISELAEGRAIVESVDQQSRTVLLRDDHGELETSVVSPEVRNLPQVHPGDHVLVSLHRSVAVEMSKAGPGPAPAVEETAGRAAPGTKPAAFRSETVRARVQITAIDLANQTVSFVGPARIQRVLQIKDPRLLSFVRTLHEGDEVDVTYRLGVAALRCACKWIDQAGKDRRPGELQLVWPMGYRSAYLGARAAEAFAPTTLIQVNA